VVETRKVVAAKLTARVSGSKVRAKSGIIGHEARRCGRRKRSRQSGRYGMNQRKQVGNKRVGNPHIGSSVKDFLREEGSLEEIRAIAIKEVVAWQTEGKEQSTTRFVSC
jgi:hypothetical protein